MSIHIDDMVDRIRELIDFQREYMDEYGYEVSQRLDDLLMAEAALCDIINNDSDGPNTDCVSEFIPTYKKNRSPNTSACDWDGK